METFFLLVWLFHSCNKKVNKLVVSFFEYNMLYFVYAKCLSYASSKIRVTFPLPGPIHSGTKLP